MTSSEIRRRFLEFFKKRGHAEIPSASLVTSDEKGLTNPTLFNTAGMQPIIPYLLGKSHPLGKRLVNIQKCLRTTDIDDVGDNVHATFFEMMGNWSLGDYFKEEAIKWSYEFLTSKEEGLGLDPNRLYISVFEGDSNAERDIDSVKIWRSVGIPENRIYFKDASSNWWPAVKGKDDWTGPTGPCSEMFYDVTKEGLGDLSPEEFTKADTEQKVVEVWNDVFMEFEKKDGIIVGKLSQKNVDTGAGFERLVMVMQNVDSIYDTDLLKPVMEKIKEFSKNWDEKAARIVADHIRASVFLFADGITPSNTGRGYVLRRLIRRAVRHADRLGIKQSSLTYPLREIIDIYGEIYTHLISQENEITSQFNHEELQFRETANKGFNELKRRLKDTGTLTTKDIFDFYQSFGLSKDQLKETLIELPVVFNEQEFDSLVKKHQILSRSGASQKFKGGLADANDEMVVRYHTATHLLHQALHDVLGDSVMQKGSNITAERLRFDFSHAAKMTDEEKKKVEDIVNEKISQKLPVQNVTMPKAEAEKTGARHSFDEKYNDEISIYFIGNDLQSAYSKEFCGGPHVKNTSELAGPEGKWRFKIQKEEAVAQGVRRIKAVLE